MLFASLVCIAVLLASCVQPVFAESGEQTEVHMGQTVKVGLKYGSNAVSRFTLGCDSGFCVVSYSADGKMQILQRISATEIEVISEGGNVTIKDAGTGDAVLDGMTTGNVILPYFYSEGYNMTIDGTAYRGGAMFTLESSGNMNLINLVNIDEYVCGVLPSEIGGGSPLETIKAQAVAARSYATTAASEGGNHASMGFDVCPSTHCQVYRGIKNENENCNLAAKETAGLCLYYEGKPVQGYYAKNSGGYTQNVEDVWSSKLGYLRAVPDPYCPAYPWEKEYSFSELESKLLAAGKNVGTLTKVEITALSDNGNVKEITFTGTGGTAVYSKYNLRSFFGSSEVKSTMFRFDGAMEYVEVSKSGAAVTSVQGSLGSATAESHDGTLMMKNLFLQNAAGAMQRAGSNEAFAISGNGDIRKVYADRGNGLYAINAEGKKYLVNSTGKEESDNSNAGSDTGDTVRITTVTGKTVETSGTLHIYGLGYGHGIGLMQDGAIAMGKLGCSYEQILKYYYTGIEIR